jgi:glycosyltransferase involved in cell wall biosynthesis
MASTLGPWKLRGRAFDVIFVNQLSPVTVGIPGALMARIKNAPMVMWVLDLWPDTLQAIGVVRSPRLLGLVRSLTKFIYSRCDVVLAQSKSFIPAIKKIAPARLPVKYLPSWAEDVFQQRMFASVLEIPQREDCFDVMFAGNIGEAQDFPCILAAADALRAQQHIRWLIVGDGRLRVWVEQEIHRRGLEDRVLLLGRFPVERMPSFYQRAHVLLVTLQDKPIFNMTIPGKLQSYLAAARPIVAALNGEGAELIRESGAGYVSAAGDYAGLAQAVLALSLLSADQRRSLGENGKKFSDRQFLRDSTLVKVEEILNKSIADFPFERSKISIQ